MLSADYAKSDIGRAWLALDAFIGWQRFDDVTDASVDLDELIEQLSLMRHSHLDLVAEWFRTGLACEHLIFGISCGEERVLNAANFVCRLIVENKIHFSQPLTWSNTLSILRAAIENGYESLVYHYAKTCNEFLSIRSSVHKACAKGYCAIVQFLINTVAQDYLYAFDRCASLLRTAIESNQHQTFVRLFYEFVQKNIRIDIFKEEYLKAAAKYGNLESFRFLLEETCFYEKKDYNLYIDVFEKAAKNNHVPIVRYILNRELELFNELMFREYMPYWWTRAVFSNESLDVVRFLFDEYFSNFEFDEAFLKMLVIDGNVHILRYFLDEHHGTRVDIHAYDDVLLIESIRKNRLDFVRYLLDERNGEHSNVHVRNERALELAFYNNYEEMVDLLLNENRIDRPYFTNSMREELHWAENNTCVTREMFFARLKPCFKCKNPSHSESECLET